MLPVTCHLSRSRKYVCACLRTKMMPSSMSWYCLLIVETPLPTSLLLLLVWMSLYLSISCSLFCVLLLSPLLVVVKARRQYCQSMYCTVCTQVRDYGVWSRYIVLDDRATIYRYVYINEYIFMVHSPEGVRFLVTLTSELTLPA